MKKSIVIATIMLLLMITFLISNITIVYGAEEKAIDTETESKIVELKDNALNSIEDYKVKYRFRCLWNSSIYTEFS